jgi:hypothetical protein
LCVETTCGGEGSSRTCLKYRDLVIGASCTFICARCSDHVSCIVLLCAAAAFTLCVSLRIVIVSQLSILITTRLPTGIARLLVIHV